MNKTGVEFDFVVKDSLQALPCESIFEVERLEVTDYRGTERSVLQFTTRHLLTEIHSLVWKPCTWSTHVILVNVIVPVLPTPSESHK